MSDRNRSYSETEVPCTDCYNVRAMKDCGGRRRDKHFISIVDDNNE